LSLNSDGSFQYTPTPGYYGSDSFTYRDWDGYAYSSPATVSITVNRVNHPPVANDDAYSINEDASLTIDPVPGTMSLTMVSQPGDCIGQGRTYSFSLATGRFAASRNYDNGVSLSYQDTNFPNGEWWYLDFAAPYNATPVPGYYGNARRFPFQASYQPGL